MKRDTFCPIVGNSVDIVVYKFVLVNIGCPKPSTGRGNSNQRANFQPNKEFKCKLCNYSTCIFGCRNECDNRIFQANQWISWMWIYFWRWSSKLLGEPDETSVDLQASVFTKWSHFKSKNSFAGTTKSFQLCYSDDQSWTWRCDTMVLEIF